MYYFKIIKIIRSSRLLAPLTMPRTAPACFELASRTTPRRTKHRHGFSAGVSCKPAGRIRRTWTQNYSRIAWPDLPPHRMTSIAIARECAVPQRAHKSTPPRSWSAAPLRNDTCILQRSSGPKELYFASSSIKHRGASLAANNLTSLTTHTCSPLPGAPTHK